MADDQTAKAPVYVSYLTFANLLDWLRELNTIPRQFDRSFWGAKYSGATGGQLMTGLRFLGLLDGDTPEDRLEQLALASDPERKPLLAALLRDAYGAELVDGLPRATPKMVRDALYARGATDGIFRKAQSFFINAAKAADLPMPVAIAKQARNKPGPSKKPTSTPKSSKPKSDPVRSEEPAPDKPAEEAPYKPPTALHRALVPILDDLPRVGPEWTVEGQERWLATFRAVLDYAYPVKATEDEK